MWVSLRLGYRFIVITRIIYFTFSITYEVSDNFYVIAIVCLFKGSDQSLVSSPRTKFSFPYIQSFSPKRCQDKIEKYCIHRNFHQEKFLPSALIDKNFITRIFLSCVNDYIEDMATFTALAKIYSTKYFCNTKVGGLGKIFVQRNFCRIRYLQPPTFNNIVITIFMQPM